MILSAPDSTSRSVQLPSLVYSSEYPFHCLKLSDLTVFPSHTRIFSLINWPILFLSYNFPSSLSSSLPSALLISTWRRNQLIIEVACSMNLSPMRLAAFNHNNLWWSLILCEKKMAANDWINSYLEAILDVEPGINDSKSSLLLRERGRFSPARYFVEEVISGFDETDLHRTWAQVCNFYCITTFFFFFSPEEFMLLISFSFSYISCSGNIGGFLF